MRKLLIDVGSSNIKWAIVEKNQMIFHDSKAFPQPLVNENCHFEVDADEIIRIIKEIITQSLPLDSIYFASQMHGYVLLDKNHNRLTNYISWQDKRASLYPIHFKMKSSNGVHFKCNLPKASLIALEIENKSLYDEACSFCTLGSYISFCLTKQNISHISDCAPSGFYNILNLEKEKCKFSLPEPTKEIKKIGTYRNIHVYTPIGDQQASIYGIDEENCYILNLGTASQMATIHPTYIEGEFETRPFLHNDYLLTISNLPSSKEILDGMDEKTLINTYQNAIKQLPKREKIIITGGLVQVKKELLKKVFDEIKIPYFFNEGLDSLKGLEKISKENYDDK